MNGLRAALLVIGTLNLVLLGAVACGERAAPVAPDDLTARLVKLEAWRMLQEHVTSEHGAALNRQADLNRSFQEALKAAQAHAASVDRSLTKQAEALEILGSILQDLRKKPK